jgi:hypothetical protein
MTSKWLDNFFTCLCRLQNDFSQQNWLQAYLYLGNTGSTTNTIQAVSEISIMPTPYRANLTWLGHSAMSRGRLLSDQFANCA